jgi:hypothetical protein
MKDCPATALTCGQNRIMSIHVGGTFLCTKAEINAMVKAGHGGSIVVRPAVSSEWVVGDE